ncbi:LEA type 2 family protein [Quisquiliibacterium transsilvanicum]|uniref:Water stress and hypersensitive response domain-containing protein n=1 Tax=Quisquiliibacterium transsilvanicum TaxID=1549638 RepID=A0A7W8HHD7_9BURK|nr:LEA type 2 family protein [Quisquiliibacterium transsilvanicum]MBB5272079.1 hypothetical protein [Quisquiliibacterium transsilvanicum]
MPLPRRRLLAAGAALAAVSLATGCAGFGFGEPVSVVVVGLDPIPGESMEARFALRLRVQNPNEQALEFDGIHVELDVRGSRLASGVSAQRGTVARFGETVVTVPMSVSVIGIIRQAVDFATGPRVRADYAMRGRLAGPGLGFGGARFESKGELRIPEGLLEPAK